MEYERAVNVQPHLLASPCTFSPTVRFTDPPEGAVSFICRIRKSGTITIATETFDIDPQLAWDYVYATIVVHEHTLKIYHKGEVIKTFPYKLKI